MDRPVPVQTWEGEPGPDADDVARGWGEDIRQVAQLVECLARARQGGEVGHELPLVRTSASWPAVAPRDARQYRTRLVAWAGCQEPQRYVREGWLTANAGAWAGAERSATPHSTQCRATREYSMQHDATWGNTMQRRTALSAGLLASARRVTALGAARRARIRAVQGAERPGVPLTSGTGPPPASLPWGSTLLLPGGLAFGADRRRRGIGLSNL